ncbi:MAG TPA: hypothetical protein VNS34_23860 [Rhizobiaceae bacterium]|nr:hypothetical protein [Rhizobiaceae bacterium]
MTGTVLSSLIYCFSAEPAMALDAREVQAVVTVLEKLASETGDTVYYDDEAAEQWFEIDDESSQLIPAAGFTRASWKEAFDQTMTGFIASIPDAEFEQMMEDFIDKIAEIARMTPEQKQTAAEGLRAERGKFDAIRNRGAKYKAVIIPYAERLRKIALQGQG